MTTSTITFQPLSKEIKTQGKTLQQVWRNADSAIYKESHGYEVIAIKKVAAEDVFGKHLPPREVYPGNEDWGRLGKTRYDGDSLESLQKLASTLAENRYPKERAF
jgi:hypothetical protein